MEKIYVELGIYLTGIYVGLDYLLDCFIWEFLFGYD